MASHTTTGRYWDLGPLLVCRHCSTRTTLETLSRDELAAHEAWHQSEVERFKALEVEILAARRAQA